MAATNPVELRAKRRNMAAYLEADHTPIVLSRPKLTKTPAGGMVKGPYTALPSQKFRFYPLVRRLGDLTRDTPDGNINRRQWVLVGLHTADVQAGDRFILNGGQYEVDSVGDEAQDRKEANVTYHGLATDDAWASGPT